MKSTRSVNGAVRETVYYPFPTYEYTPDLGCVPTAVETQNLHIDGSSGKPLVLLVLTMLLLTGIAWRFSKQTSRYLFLLLLFGLLFIIVPVQAETLIVDCARVNYFFGDQSVAVRTNGDLYYLHKDRLGSVNVMSNASGSIVAGSVTKFEPFGGYRQEPTATFDPTDMGYTGHIQDDEIGLIYMNARYYIPSIGRFLSPDSIIPGAENPQALNRYSYTFNNPTGFTDPDGHNPCAAGYQACVVFNEINRAFDTFGRGVSRAVDRIGRYAIGYGVGAVPYLDTGEDILVATTGCSTACRLGIEEPVGGFWRGVATAGVVLPFGYRSVKTASALRNAPGLVTGGENLPVVTGQWLRGAHGNAGKVPRQVADNLRGRSFSNFDSFREAFWLEVSNQPELLSQFSRPNQTLIRNGNAPYASPSQHVGLNMKYSLHHNQPIHAGGGVYNLDNITVVTPCYHKEALDPKYHYNR